MDDETAMRRAFLLLAIPACAGLLCGQTADWRFAPPDATVFAGVEWSRLGVSFQGLLKDAGISGKASLNFLSRLERIHLAFVMRGEEPAMVAMLEGNFRPSDLTELSRASGLCPGKVKTTADQMAITQIDARHVVVGDKAEVKRALARMGQPAHGLPAALVKAEPALRQGDFWVIGNLPRNLGPLLAMTKPAARTVPVLPLVPRQPEEPKYVVIHGMAGGPMRVPLP